ncbi:MAG: protease HtpX [Elusimicrobiales bacterium]|jgi:heat shock protein HtpX|nr:protease HtpX [Elusimicrobiales bacterium]
MKLAKRVILFVLLNVLIITTLSITMQLLGVRPYLEANGIDYAALIGFCLVWGMGGAFISLALSRVMAKWMMGVQVIDPNTTDPALSRLVASVHNLAKAAGLPKMPEVGVYDSPEVNAFATGPTRSRALVAVSAGLLEAMDWEQVEGVLGHEIAHIANGDMVTMTLLQGVINAIVMFLARVIAFFIFRNSRDGGGAMQHLVVIALQIVLSFLGMILLAAFSRYREYRADAGGAGLAGRDKMINALEGLRRTVKYADATGHQSVAAFKISSGPGGFMKLFSTHPPLEERIARLKAGA